MEALTITIISLADIHADDDFNCRGRIIPLDVAELSRDIERQSERYPETFGLISPIVVIPYSEDKQQETGKKYLLIAGYRRFNAFLILKRDKIACIIRPNMTEEDARILNLCENLQRKDLTVMQEAKAIANLQVLGLGEHETADRLGTSRGWVQVRFMLLKLPIEVQKEVAAGFITQTQIRELFMIYKSAGKERCFEATKKLKDAKILGRKGASVNIKKAKSTSKHHRSRKEMFDMIEHIIEFLPHSLYTRTLAWAAGNISSDELYISINEEAKIQNRYYSKPAEKI